MGKSMLKSHSIPSHITKVAELPRKFWIDTFFLVEIDVDVLELLNIHI
jgi:hypothetical protein